MPTRAPPLPRGARSHWPDRFPQTAIATPFQSNEQWRAVRPRAFFEDREHYATENYDPRTMLAEISVMNNVLFGIDGKDVRTYSYPCSQHIVGGADYTEALRRSATIRYARTGGDPYTAVVSEPRKLDEYRVPSWGFVDKPDGAQLIALVESIFGATEVHSGAPVLELEKYLPRSEAYISNYPARMMMPRASVECWREKKSSFE